jgi:hypothetical protein
MHVVWDSDVPNWMAIGGVFVDARKTGGEGKRFFRNGFENLHDF